MGELSRLPNIGKEVERQLNEAGILSAEDLKNLGAEKAWLKIQKLDPSACIHRLLADRKSTRLNSSHRSQSRMPSSA